MQRSWGENKEQPLRYTAEFFRSAFDYPGSGLDLAPAIYRNHQLVAFFAGFPRTVRIAGQPRKLLCNSFLTVAPEQKRSGYGPILWGELLKRARSLGYDGVLDFCVEGDDMNRQMLPMARAFREPTAHIFTVPYLARLLRGSESTPAVEGSDCETSAVLLAAASRIGKDVPLIRTWSHEEAEWQCRRRHGAVNAALCVNGRRGMLSGYAIETSGTPPMLCVVLDEILWGDLQPDECLDLTRLFLSKASQLGARLITSPVLNYAEMKPLAQLGFRKSRRLLQAYLTLWTAPVLGELTSMYVDVF